MNSTGGAGRAPPRGFCASRRTGEATTANTTANRLIAGIRFARTDPRRGPSQGEGCAAGGSARTFNTTLATAESFISCTNTYRRSIYRGGCSDSDRTRLGMARNPSLQPKNHCIERNDVSRSTAGKVSQTETLSSTTNERRSVRGVGRSGAIGISPRGLGQAHSKGRWRRCRRLSDASSGDGDEPLEG